MKNFSISPGRLQTAISKSSIDREITEKKLSTSKPFMIGEWVYDLEDTTFHGIITDITDDEYRVSAPSPHPVSTDERILPESRLKRHVPKEFR